MKTSPKGWEDWRSPVHQVPDKAGRKGRAAWRQWVLEHCAGVGGWAATGIGSCPVLGRGGGGMTALMPLGMVPRHSAAPSSSVWGQGRMKGPLGGMERDSMLPNTTLAPQFPLPSTYSPQLHLCLLAPVKVPMASVCAQGQEENPHSHMHTGTPSPLHPGKPRASWTWCSTPS